MGGAEEGGARGPDGAVEGRVPGTGVARATAAEGRPHRLARSAEGRPRLAPHCFPASWGAELLLGYEIALLTAKRISRARLSHR